MKLYQKVNEIAEQAIEKQMKDLPQKVESIISSSILSLLGLSGGYRGNEIDHCNGRWNLFAEVLKAEAKNDVEKIVKELKVRFNINDFTEAFQKEYMSHFRSHLSYKAKELADQKVKAYVESRLNKVVENLNKRELPKKG